ncbi:MAG: hypothetical protein JOZ69_24455, partial [Myxococcales bacterium]|nr:hypothetical protein [Myxococcales bacterium]
SKARAAGQAGRAKVASERAAALAPKLSNLIVDVPSEVRVAGLEIRRDGELLGPAEWGTPLPTDPGDHKVQASAPGHKAWEKPISVAGGAATARLSVPALEVIPPVETAAPVATVPATPRETPLAPIPTKDAVDQPSAGIGRPLGLVLGGVGLAGIAVGAVFGLLTKGAVDRANQECPSRTCGPGYVPAMHDHDQAVQFGLISDVGFIAGGAFVVGGTALFLLSGPGGKRSSEETGLAVMPTAGPLGGGLSLQGSF